MDSYEFSKTYSKKMMKVISKIVLKKKFPKNGYSYNLKSFGLDILFTVNLTNGYVINVDGEDVISLYPEKSKEITKASCGYFCMDVPIFVNDFYRQDLEEVYSILIHEFTHLYQFEYCGVVNNFQIDKNWIERDIEQEAVANEFKFDLEKGKDFYDLIEVGNYKKLYDVNPKLLENLKKG